MVMVTIKMPGYGGTSCSGLCDMIIRIGPRILENIYNTVL